MDWCVENEIKHVFCGNPEGVKHNTSGKKKLNRVKNKKKIRKKKVSQKLSNWNFGKMMKILEYKLNAQNIKFKKINEKPTQAKPARTVDNGTKRTIATTVVLVDTKPTEMWLEHIISCPLENWDGLRKFAILRRKVQSIYDYL